MNLVEIARMIAALAVTLGLVGVATVAMRRFGPISLLRLKPASERRMQVIESLILDPQRRLILVRCDQRERLILLGEGRLLGDVQAATSASEAVD